MENAQWVCLRNGFAVLVILIGTSTASADSYTVQTGSSIETHSSAYSSTGGVNIESGTGVTAPSHSSSLIQTVLQSGHSTGTLDIHTEDIKNGVTEIDDRHEILINPIGFEQGVFAHTPIQKNSIRVYGPHQSSASVRREAQPQIQRISLIPPTQISTSSPITMQKHMSEGVFVTFAHSFVYFFRFLFSAQ